MAVIGGNAGYATVEGPQRNYIGEAMANVENSGFKYREEQNALNEQKKREERILKQERDDELKEANALDDKYKITDTGIQSVDTKVHNVLLKLKQLSAQANMDYKNAKTNEEKSKAFQVISNSKTALNTLKQFPDAYNASTEQLTKGLSEGIYSKASSKRKAAELDKFANGQYVVDVDDRGNILFSTFDMDENGQVSKVKSKDLTAQQMLQNFNPTKAFNIDGTGSGTKKGDSLIKIYKDNLNKERKVTIGTGLNAKEKIYTPGADELAKIMASEAVQDKDKLYEVFDRLEIDPENSKNYNNPDYINKATKYLYDKLRGIAPTDISDKPDDSLERLKIAKESAAETRKQHGITNNREAERDRERRAGTTTTSTTEKPLTEIGKKAREKFYADPKNKGFEMLDSDYPAGSYVVNKTSSTKSNYDPNKKEPTKTYSKNEESAINLVMRNNTGISREQAIKALKDAGKIK